MVLWTFDDNQKMYIDKVKIICFTPYENYVSIISLRLVSVKLVEIHSVFTDVRLVHVAHIYSVMVMKVLYTYGKLKK